MADKKSAGAGSAGVLREAKKRKTSYGCGK
jgi:hypothetical protein